MLKGVQLEKSETGSLCFTIEDISDELKVVIRARLSEICHGAAKASRTTLIYSYQATLKAFFGKFDKKSLDTQKGMIGELLTHVLFLHYEDEFRAASPFFNMEEDSIKKGFFSSVVGLLLVLLFIGVYYRVSGLIADIGLLFNMFFLLAVMAALGATLTMPGIAGIILTIGISVDANILIFERIREELRTGKTVRASIDAGYSRAFVAIFDSHVTTLITAGALFLLGSGPIKGFAVTLIFGLIANYFTALWFTRLVYEWVLQRFQPQRLSI